MKTNFQSFQKAFLTAAVFASVSANAALTSQGTTTVDTSTGLQWLNLTQTTGISPDQIAAGYGGYAAAGYVWATQLDFQYLVADAGGHVDSNPLPETINVAATESLGSLLGWTGPNEFLGAGQLGADPFGGYDGVVMGGTLFPDSVPEEANLTIKTNDIEGNALPWPSVWAEFLVRPVPEPSDYALMLVGLGVLGFVARRRSVRSRA